MSNKKRQVRTEPYLTFFICDKFTCGSRDSSLNSQLFYTYYNLNFTTYSLPFCNSKGNLTFEAPHSVIIFETKRPLLRDAFSPYDKSAESEKLKVAFSTSGSSVSRVVSEYKEFKTFYNECTKEVIDFCEKRKLAYHIKKRTID